MNDDARHAPNAPRRYWMFTVMRESFALDTSVCAGYRLALPLSYLVYAVSATGEDYKTTSAHPPP